MPLLIRRVKMEEAVRQARIVLTKAGLGHRFSHKPAQMSGGERQRTAIARAVVGAPACVLADEPTGNLDSNNGVKIIKILQDLNKNLDIAILLATHSDVVAAATQKVLQMYDGEIKKC